MFIIPSTEEGLSEHNELRFHYPRDIIATPKPVPIQYVRVDNRTNLYKLIDKKGLVRTHVHKNTAYLAYIAFRKANPNSEVKTCQEFVNHLESMFCFLFNFYDFCSI